MIVCLVLVVCPVGAEPPSAEAAADRLFEGVVVGFVRGRILLVGSVKPCAHVGELVVWRAVFRDEFHADSVSAVVVNDAHNCHMALIHFNLRLVLELIPERAFPLRTRDAVEAPIVQAFAAFYLQSVLNHIEARDGFFVNLCKADFLRVSHEASLPLMRYGRRNNLDRWPSC